MTTSKKTSPKLDGTCAVCTNVQRTRDGRMVLHGYQRPGWGHINGRCFGAGEMAWELSPDAAKAHVIRMQGWKQHHEGFLMRLKAGEVKELYHGHDMRRVSKEGDADFPRLLKYRIEETRERVEELGKDIYAFEMRIELWTKGELQPVVQEVKHCTVRWIAHTSEYVAFSCAKGERAIASSYISAQDALADAARKGYTVLPGSLVPPVVPSINRFAVVKGEVSQTQRIRECPDATLAKLFVDAYETWSEEDRAIFDKAPLRRILSTARRVSAQGFAHTVDPKVVLDELKSYY